MTKLILPRLIAKAHVSGYTNSHGTYVAEHEDKRQKHADALPSHAPGSRVKDKWGDSYTVVGPDPKDPDRIIAHEDGAARPVSMPLSNLVATSPKAAKKTPKDFDTGRVFYHYSNEESVKEVGEGQGRFGGLFTLENKTKASHYGKHGHMFVARGEVFDNAAFSKAIKVSDRKVRAFVKKELGGNLASSAVSDVLWLIQDETRAMGDAPPNGTLDSLMRAMGAVDDSDLYAEAQKLRGSVARMLGASAIHMNDEFGDDSVMLVSKENTKHIGTVSSDTVTKSTTVLYRLS